MVGHGAVSSTVVALSRSQTPFEIRVRFRTLLPRKPHRFEVWCGKPLRPSIQRASSTSVLFASHSSRLDSLTETGTPCCHEAHEATTVSSQRVPCTGGAGVRVPVLWRYGIPACPSVVFGIAAAFRSEDRSAFAWPALACLGVARLRPSAPKSVWLRRCFALACLSVTRLLPFVPKNVWLLPSVASACLDSRSLTARSDERPVSTMLCLTNLCGPPLLPSVPKDV
jgi:hypothetical protein